MPLQLLCTSAAQESPPYTPRRPTNSKEPYKHSKEPYKHSKEPYKHSREPSIQSKETHILKRAL